VFAIQKGTAGVIVALNKNNRLTMVNADPKVVSLVEKDKFEAVIRVYNEVE